MGFLATAVPFVGGLISGKMGSDAAKDAANTQAGAAIRAAEIQARSEEQARQDLAPFADAGRAGIEGLVGAATGQGPAQPFLDELNQGTRDAQGFTGGDTALVNAILRDPNAYQQLIDRAAPSDADRALAASTAAGPRSITDFVNAGMDPATVNLLRQQVSAPGDTSFERKEGFRDIINAARAGGKFSGGTLRDLTQFSDALNRQDQQRRISNLADLVGIESGLRGQRFGELLTGRATERGELMDQVGLDRMARATRLDELLRGRQQRLNEFGVAGGVEQGVRDRETARLQNRLGVNLGIGNQRFSNLFDLVRLGQSSAAGQAAGARATGADIAGLTVGAGNARAAGQIGAANARRNTIFDLATLAPSVIDYFQSRRKPTAGAQPSMRVS